MYRAGNVHLFEVSKEYMHFGRSGTSYRTAACNNIVHPGTGYRAGYVHTLVEMTCSVSASWYKCIGLPRGCVH